MAAILHQNAAIGRDRMSILAATEIVTMSMVRTMEHNSAALLQTPIWPGED